MNSRKPITSEVAVGNMTMRDMVHTLTGGRPYLFVIMAYNARWDLYERIKKIAEKEFNVACIRADEVKSSGYDLLAKIHLLISRAEIVIAEISEPTENVFYEIGYAVGIQKLPMILIEQGNKVPTDLKGLEVVEYMLNRDGTLIFETELRDQLRLRLNSEIALLRDMLEAPTPQPAYVISSPKYPGKHSRIIGQVYDRRTFGDHIGILGLISAWGSLRGGSPGLELISAHHSPPDLLSLPLSLYLIGSEKINSHTGEMLKQMQKGHNLNWGFDPLPGFSREDEDWPCVLYRTKGRKREMVRGKTKKCGTKREEVWIEDYGIIVRGPHPSFFDRLVLILAGAHSLGTGAACLAATNFLLIQQIRNMLPEGVIENKQRSFWVLVKGVANDKDGLLDVEGVKIEDAGVYE
jgi:hypothetical protein